MKKIIIKNHKVTKAGIILIAVLGLAGLTACNTKKVETVTQEPGQVQNQDTTQEPTQNPTLEPTKAPQADNQTTDSDQYKNMDQLATLLGLSKEELTTKVNSEYNVVDEGGLEFVQPKIRVWFDEDSKVNQIFTVDSEIDFDGLKVGDDIKSFQEKLGDPTKDNNGEAHFKSGDLFVVVHYDTETGKSYDVYLLNKDF
ncbi:MAG: hypothetical protein H6Q59_924 [Firmicutes bacterium]|nr:hypothetical protein [Bacillota bacterium]